MRVLTNVLVSGIWLICDGGDSADDGSAVTGAAKAFWSCRGSLPATPSETQAPVRRLGSEKEI